MSDSNGFITGGSRNAQSTFLAPGMDGGNGNFRHGPIQRLMVEAGCNVLYGIGGMWMDRGARFSHMDSYDGVDQDSFRKRGSQPSRLRKRKPG